MCFFFKEMFLKLGTTHCIYTFIREKLRVRTLHDREHEGYAKMNIVLIGWLDHVICRIYARNQYELDNISIFRSWYL